MLRYFIAWNFWLAFALILVLARGNAHSAQTYYTVFGMGWITPEIFWSVVVIALGTAGLCAYAWRHSLHRTA